MITYERQLQELAEFDARGANVLSVYLRTDPLQLSTQEIETQLQRLTRPLRAGLSREDDAALAAEVAAVLDYLHSLLAPPASIVIFACAPRQFFRIVRLPIAVVPAVFWTPHPEIEMLQVAEQQAEARLRASPCTIGS